MPSLIICLKRLPGSAAALQLFIAHVQMQATRLDVELDHIAFLDQRQTAAYGSLGRYVQHNCIKSRPDIRPSEMRTISRTPFSNIFLGNPILPTSAMPG